MPNQAHSGIEGNPWHICGRCGADYRLRDLQWQEGVLVCPSDFDKETVRQRDLQLVRDLDYATMEPDAQTDPKLRFPQDRAEED